MEGKLREKAKGSARWRFSVEAPALRSRDFRLYWTGNLAAYLAHWVLVTSIPWLMLDLTGSALFLGFLGLARAVPAIPLSMLGGVLADRVGKRSLLLITQSVGILVSVAFLLLVRSRVVDPWMVLGLSLLWSTSNSLDGAARQSIVAELVEKEHLLNALALNASGFNLGRVVGPALAGGIIAWGGGLAWTFAPAAIALVVMFGALLALKKALRPVGGAKPWATDLVEGLRYVLRNRAVSGLLLLVAGATFFGMAYTVVVPIFAKDILKAGAGGFGLLMSASAVGALLASLMLGLYSSRWKRGQVVQGSALAFGGLLLLFAVSHWFLLTLAISAALGAANSLYLTTANTLLQAIVSPEMRGRVMGLYVLSPAGLHHLGMMSTGALTEVSSAPLAVALGGAITVIVVLAAGHRAPEVGRL